MSDFNCRGKENRIKLIKKYEIKPMAHLPLLNGQIKRSAAKDEITREYYYFSYKEKGSNREPETFICGISVAKDFLTLLKLDPIPLFNILGFSRNSYSKKGKKPTSIEIEKVKLDPLALEIYNVINIILIVWDTNKTGPMSSILDEIKKYKNKQQLLKYVKSINTIIHKDSKERTIYQMLNSLKKKNKIKDFDFPIIKETLSKEGIPNYITG